VVVYDFGTIAVETSGQNGFKQSMKNPRSSKNPTSKNPRYWEKPKEW